MNISKAVDIVDGLERAVQDITRFLVSELFTVLLLLFDKVH